MENNEQLSEEWFKERLGLVTASRMADLMAKTKSGYSTSRQNYMAELIIQRLTGKPTDSYTNAAMQWGIDTEAQARAAYELSTDNDVKTVGFIKHSELEAGASPDGLVNDFGLVEIKCPNQATHLEFLLNPVIADKYQKQMQWQLECTNREWCDFASFDSRFPLNMQLKIVRVNRNEAMIAEIKGEVTAFLSEMAQKLIKLGNL